MAGKRDVLAICDSCGFRYKLNQLKKNSYGMMVCPSDFDRSYDLKNHPQNKSPKVEERPFIQDVRPEGNGGINQAWLQATTQWNNNLKYWNLI